MPMEGRENPQRRQPRLRTFASTLYRSSEGTFLVPRNDDHGRGHGLSGKGSSMAENFSNQLAQWVEQRGLQRSDKNLVAFMTVRDDVKLAIDAGYAVKTVWANLRETGRIDLGYKTFLNYVRRCLGPSPEPAAANPVKPATTVAAAAPPSRESNPVKTPTRVMPLAMPGFVYNPVANKEELL
jgi:hypothetical protein